MNASTATVETSGIFQELVLEHRDLARRFAQNLLRRWGMRLDTDDLHGIVDLALCEAAERFDPAKGAQFQTFLFYYIRGHLTQTARTSVRAQRLKSTIYTSISHFSVSGTKAGESDFDGPIACNEVCDQSVKTPEDAALSRAASAQLEAAVAALDELHRKVLHLRCFENKSHAETAKLMGVTRKTVLRLESEAVSELRARMLGAPSGPGCTGPTARKPTRTLRQRPRAAFTFSLGRLAVKAAC
ncbi:MAG: sigma-70 family RNA polymerase sigma factor [Bdellovibrionales bacterium]|nr:sigma-70 family RNA polymerase sigma factor [Bdellovibrionales bacterium]